MKIEKELKNLGFVPIGVFLIWVLVTFFLYFGIYEVEIKGNIEVSMILAFSIVVLGIHLISLLKNEYRKID